MPKIITESEVEEASLDMLEELGYKIIYGPDISEGGINEERKYNEVVLVQRLRNALQRINKDIPKEAIEEAIKKIEDQYSKPEVIGEIHAKELMGKWVKGPLVNYDIYLVPGWFIDAKIGSGIVYSALEDPVDLIEIKDIQKDLDRIKKYNLNLEVIKKLKPISIIDVPGLGLDLGQDMINKYKISSANEKNKIKDAKDELNKTVFRKGVMKSNCSKYSGMTVPIAQEKIKRDLIDAEDAVMFYELTGKVVCRCLTESIIKLVSDQWFIDYGNEDWKKLAYKCLNQMKLLPYVDPEHSHILGLQVIIKTVTIFEESAAHRNTWTI